MINCLALSNYDVKYLLMVFGDDVVLVLRMELDKNIINSAILSALFLDRVCSIVSCKDNLNFGRFYVNHEVCSRF